MYGSQVPFDFLHRILFSCFRKTVQFTPLEVTLQEYFILSLTKPLLCLSIETGTQICSLWNSISKIIFISRC